MIPINEPERKEALKKFWGLYGAMGFALLCMLMGGMILKNGTLSKDERDDFKSLKENELVAEKMTERLEKLSPRIKSLFDTQHALHDSLHHKEKGEDLTKKGYTDALNMIAIESRVLADSVNNCLKSYEKAAQASQSKNLNNEFLNTLSELLSESNKGYVKLNESGNAFRISGGSVVGIAEIIPAVITNSGETVSPEEKVKDDQIAQLQAQLQTFKDDKQNEALAKAMDERDKAIQNANIQRSLKNAQKHLATAQGMLTVAESFIESVKPHSTRAWYEKNLQASYRTKISTYSGAITSSLAEAEGALGSVDNAEAISMRAEISNLRQRNAQMSSSLN